MSAYICVHKLAFLGPAICLLYTFSEGRVQRCTNERIYDLHSSYPIETRNGVKNGRMTEKERERERERERETERDRDRRRQRKRQRRRQRQRESRERERRERERKRERKRERERR